MRLTRPPASKALPLLLWFLLASGLPGQDVRLRSRVDLVVVAVSVEGKDGQPIAGLSESDFTVLEDGRKQSIASFSADPVPISAVLLIDTGLSEGSLTRVKNSFTALVGAFAEDDEIALYRFDKYVEKLMDFSVDKMVVETALQKLQDYKPLSSPTGGGPFSNPGPVINGVPVVPGVQMGSRLPPATKVLNDAIFEAGEALGARDPDRRKMLMVVSDGENRGSNHSFDATLDRLLGASIQVYAAGMDSAFLTRGASALGSYASSTGGKACFLNSQNALETCYSQITEMARNQYLLTYVSSNRATGGKPVFRKIKIQMGRSGQTAHHKKGYQQYP